MEVVDWQLTKFAANRIELRTKEENRPALRRCRMAHFDDAKDLVNHAKNAMPKLEQDYRASLNGKTVQTTLLIEIKNVMENLRSALDFSAHGLFAKYGASTKSNPRIYFPYAPATQTQAQFTVANRIENCIPGLASKRPDVVARLESYQHFASSSNSWLPLFMDLNNENKHEKLTPQTRHEARHLRIESGEAAIQVGSGASITVGRGASIKIGNNAVIRGGQTISGHSPAVIQGAATQTVVIWTSFVFDSNGQPVIPFLRTALTGVQRIVDELAAI